MREFLYKYTPVNPTTWVYLSSLLTIALYFKFNRLWSLRNLDLLGLILFAPGLLLATTGAGGYQQLGYVWLFIAAGLFLTRLLLDPLMVRRPLLEPNLSVGGLAFLGASLLLFLMANVMTSSLTSEDLAGPRMAEKIQDGVEAPVEEDEFSKYGPGYPLLFWMAHMPAQNLFGSEDVQQMTVRLVAILAHLAVVLGMIAIGYWHFDNIKTGIAAAALYLLLPYTAQLTSRVDHVLPAALLTWAVVAYRKPLAAGMLMGLATGVIYYPAFLLPLWLGFYWQRGLVRFLVGMLATLALLVAILSLISADSTMFLGHLRQMFGWHLPRMEELGGFWQLAYGINPAYRLPVLAAFASMCGSLAIWPAQKNLGTLISCTAAVMLGTQFWHPYDGGIYLCWFLPLLLLTIFRPNLEDRVALSVLGEGWFPRRRAPRQVEKAA